MKKCPIKKTQKKVKVDVAELFSKIQEHLFSLEKKIEALTNRSSFQPFQQKERHFERPPHRDNSNQRDSFRNRIFHKVTCADCHKECEVPFKPGPNRPVYCKECFSQRRSGSNMFKEKHNPMPEKSNKRSKFTKKEKPHSRKSKKH